MSDVQTRVTAADFLQRPDEDIRQELIEGAIIVSPSPLPKHQFIAMNLSFLLKLYTKAKGGKLLGAPLDVQLDEENVLQPDLMWFAPENSTGRVTESRVVGAPDLVIEILSPSTARYDKGAKRDLYQKYGTREYWIIDPQNEVIEVWQLQNDPIPAPTIYGPTDTVPSSLLQTGFDFNAVFDFDFD